MEHVVTVNDLFVATEPKGEFHTVDTRDFLCGHLIKPWVTGFYSTVLWHNDLSSLAWTLLEMHPGQRKGEP